MSYRKAGILIALLAFAGSASAVNCETANQNGITNLGCGTPVGAPEIDPASAISGMTLLLGGLAVIRGRRKKS